MSINSITARILIIIFFMFSMVALSQEADKELIETIDIENLPEIDDSNSQKALVDANGIIYINASIGQEYRIFGYADKDLTSEKVILVSPFTNEVEDNPFKLKYGSYYDFRSMTKSGIRLNYLATEEDFVKIDVFAKNPDGDGYLSDTIFMFAEFFEFER